MPSQVVEVTKKEKKADEVKRIKLKEEKIEATTGVAEEINLVYEVEAEKTKKILKVIPLPWWKEKIEMKIDATTAQVIAS